MDLEGLVRSSVDYSSAGAHKHVLSAWFFFKLMDVSGAEAIAAASAPVVGGGESACLVGPYFGLMTESELHLTMTSGTRPCHRSLTLTVELDYQGSQR
jgi:hypothetical protein